ncbi:MAG: glycosyltransferase family 4 protein, partial [Bacteroidota bacterium]
MKRILMLGWEFPPLFNGGLGIATYGVVRALCRKADIRLIIPSSAGTPVLPNVSVIGLNRITLKEIVSEGEEHDFSKLNAEVIQVPVSISPYHHANAVFFRDSACRVLRTHRMGAESDIEHIFAGTEVYGVNTLFKVRLYAILVEEVARAGDFDLIHAHDWVTYEGGTKIKKRTGKPLILHVHALETDRAGVDARNEIYQIEYDAFKSADHIIAVSQYTK